MKSMGRFGFGGSTVLVAIRGHPVSCYTTVGGGVAFTVIDLLIFTGYKVSSEQLWRATG